MRAVVLVVIESSLTIPVNENQANDR